jgi:hypothetical protein
LGASPCADSLLVCECIPYLMLTVEQSPNRTVERAAGRRQASSRACFRTVEQGAGHRRARRRVRRWVRRQTERAKQTVRQVAGHATELSSRRIAVGYSERYAEVARASRRATTAYAANDTPKRYERAVGQPPDSRRTIHRNDSSEPSGSRRARVERYTEAIEASRRAAAEPASNNTEPNLIAGESCEKQTMPRRRSARS